jgi:hypothetical protein
MGYGKKALSDFDKSNNQAFKVKPAALISNTKSFWVGVDTANDLQRKKLGLIIPKDMELPNPVQLTSKD